MRGAVASAFGVVRAFLGDIFLLPVESEPVLAVPTPVDRSDDYALDFPDRPIGRMFVLVGYSDGFRDTLHRAKYAGDPVAVTVLAGLLRSGSSVLSASHGLRIDDYDGIVLPPAPISRRIRRLWRDPLADILDRAWFAPLVIADIFRPTLHRPSQASSSRENRLANLSRPFVVRSDRLDRVAGKNLLVMDDVLSTGATAHAVARGLRNAGVRRIDGVFLASGHGFR